MNQRQFFRYCVPVIFICGLAVAMLVRWRRKPSEDLAFAELMKKSPVRHLGIIMDGNRRWAKRHGFKPWIGHRHGVEPVRTAVSFCLKYGISYLTLYAFSLENFKRPSEELNFLFDVLAQEIASKEFDELVQNGVRIVFAGDRSVFPKQLISLIDNITEKSAANDKLCLTILFCYGGQQEVVAAAKKVCAEIIAQGESAEAITQERFEKALWTSNLPPADLIVRTGHEPRLSNFLLYKAAYGDFHLIGCLWPDMTEKDLIGTLREYVRTKHSFGA